MVKKTIGAAKAATGAWELPALLDASQGVALLVEAACCPKSSWVHSRVLTDGLVATEWLQQLYRGELRSQKQRREYERSRKDMVAEDRHDPIFSTVGLDQAGGGPSTVIFARNL
jgi:hypothetical protein